MVILISDFTTTGGDCTPLTNKTLPFPFTPDFMAFPKNCNFGVLCFGKMANKYNVKQFLQGRSHIYCLRY